VDDANTRLVGLAKLRAQLDDDDDDDDDDEGLTKSLIDGLEVLRKRLQINFRLPQ
jgi:hypothetical protein